jgi:hypothetical protein
MPRPARYWLDPNWPDLDSVPPALYRYMTFERASDAISTNTLYFSSPQGFNDPFDCQVPPSFSDPVSDLEKIARRLGASAQDRMPDLAVQGRGGLSRPRTGGDGHDCRDPGRAGRRRHREEDGAPHNDGRARAARRGLPRFPEAAEDHLKRARWVAGAKAERTCARVCPLASVDR